MAVARTVDARKQRLDRGQALRLARSVARVVSTRRSAVVELDVRGTSPSDAELLACLLGPTGFLRAPALIVRRTLIVGFDPAVYQRVFP